MFDSIDRNHDGIITREEFNAAVMGGGRSNPPAPPGPPAFHQPAPSMPQGRPPPFAFRPSGPEIAAGPAYSPFSAAVTTAPVTTAAPFTTIPVTTTVSQARPLQASPVAVTREISEREDSRSPVRRRRNPGLDDESSAQLRDFRAEVEREMQDMERDLRAEMERKLASHKKAIDRDRETQTNHVREVREQLAEHGDKVGKLHSSFHQVSNTHELHRGGVSDRVDKIEKDMQFQVMKRLNQHDADIRELREIIGGEKLAREAHHDVIQDQVKRHLNDDRASRDKYHADTNQSLHHAHSTFEERLQYLEKAIGDSADKHAREIEATKKRLENLHGSVSGMAHHATVDERLNQIEQALSQLHGRVTDSACRTVTSPFSGALDSSIASLKERVEGLEHLIGGSTEKHGRDLDTLKSSHKAIHQHHATLEERMNYMEQLMGDSADKHSRYEQMHGRLSTVEQHAAAVQQLKKAHSTLASEKAALDQHTATLKERVDYLENIMGDHGDKRTRALETTNTKVEQIRSRLSSLEKHMSAISDNTKASAGISRRKPAYDEDNVLKERLDYIEEQHGIHGQGLDTAHGKMEQLHNRLLAFEKHAASLDEFQRSQASLTPGEKAGLDAQLVSLRERLQYMETTVGASNDKCVMDLEALKNAHGKHAKDLETMKALHMHHATIEERINYIEKLLGDSADKHAKELAAAHAKLDEMHGRVTTCESHGPSVAELRKHHNMLRNEKTALDAHHASLTERVDYLEGAMGDSANKHAKDIEVLKASNNRLHNQATHHANLEERLSFLEGQFGDSADKHSQLASSHSKLDKMHGTLKERLALVESKLVDHADNHEREIDNLKHAHSKLAVATRANQDRLMDPDHHQVAILDGSPSRGGADVASLAAAHRQHAEELERLKQDHANHRKRLEDLHGRHDKHAEELADAHSKCDQMCHRVTGCEAHGKALGDLKKDHSALASKKAALADDHASLKERVGLQDGMHGKHDEELRELRAAHRKLASDMKLHHDKVSHQLAQEQEARGTHHATVEERLSYIESMLGDSADKHTKEMSEAKAAHLQLAKDAKARDAHHASLAERMDYLEQVLGDGADVHVSSPPSSPLKGLGRRGLAASPPRDLYGKASVISRVDFIENCIGEKGESRSRSPLSPGSGHASLAKRLDSLEKAFSDLKDERNQMDQLQGRLSAVKEAWSSGW